MIENDVLKPLKPVFYKRYVDDIYNRCKKNCTGIELPPNI